MSAIRHLLLDANAILRYLRDDVPTQAQLVRRHVEQAGAGKLVLEIYPLILSEVVFTLESFYEVPRPRIAEVLTIFLQSPGIKMLEKERIFDALKRYREKNVSFVDAYLARLGAETGLGILSFDRGLDKFHDIERIKSLS